MNMYLKNYHNYRIFGLVCQYITKKKKNKKKKIDHRQWGLNPAHTRPST